MKRYELGYGGLDEAVDGDWVMYKDVVAAYRDSEIEALRAKLADCQSIIRDKGHDADCPAASSACAICGLHELLHPCVTYFGDSQKHNFNRGPCSESCGHDRTTGEKA